MGGHSMGKVIAGMNKVVHIMLIVLMTILVIAVFCQIVFRFFDRSLPWTEELSRYAMIWMTFLGAAYAVSTRAHIGMELFVERAQGVTKQILIVLAATISGLFFVMMIVKGYELSMRVMDQSTAVLQIPMGIVYLIMPISGAVLLINLLHVTVKELKGEMS